MSDYVHDVRCRGCGGITEAIKETDEAGNARLVTPALCPRCGQVLVCDDLGPIIEMSRDLDTSDLDTRPLSPVNWEAPEAVPTIRISAGAYGEAFANGLDLRGVVGTGAGGVIVLSDVVEALTDRASSGAGEVVG